MMGRRGQRIALALNFEALIMFVAAASATPAARVGAQLRPPSAVTNLRVSSALPQTKRGLLPAANVHMNYPTRKIKRNHLPGPSLP
jgi:hypothetical protein